MKKQLPLVSVIMPVYNAELYLREAINSILNQTYSNLELIIINDGSIDGSPHIIQSFDDKRIVYMSRENKGAGYTRNEAITMSKGQYIAIQDADDISFPERLEKQVSYLESHPDIMVLGAEAIIIDEFGEEGRYVYKPGSPEECFFYLPFFPPFMHSSVMMRKQLFMEGFAYMDTNHAEDYDLWFQILKDHKGVNLKECLYKYREYPHGVTSRESKKQEKYTRLITNNIRQYYLRNRDIYDRWSFECVSAKSAELSFEDRLEYWKIGCAFINLLLKHGDNIKAAKEMMYLEKLPEMPALPYRKWRFKMRFNDIMI